MSFAKAEVFPRTSNISTDGHLVVGGCDITELAARFGTPLYLYDEEELRARCREYIKAFGSRHNDFRVIYASKAFTNPAMAHLLHEEGLGLDVVSGGEIAVAKAVKFPPGEVYFHGNNKGRQELEEALDWGIGQVVVDNLHELSLLNELATARGKPQDVLIRITPNVDPHTHAHTTTGTLDSKFGFPIETGQAEEALRRAMDANYINPVGLHFHLGSPIFETQPYKEAIDLTLRFASRMREFGWEMKEFSPGGGFAIPYIERQIVPSTDEYAEALVSALISGCLDLGLKLPKLVVEPGRSLVGPAGVALYSVGAVKNIPGVRKYVSVDGGMGDNIRPALYGAVYEIVAASKMNRECTEKVTIAGKFCESGDVLVKDVLLPPMEAGDILAVPAAGAYSHSMASNYNLMPRPAIVMVRDGKARIIKRRENYADLMRCDSPY